MNIETVAALAVFSLGSFVILSRFMHRVRQRLKVKERLSGWKEPAALPRHVPNLLRETGYFPFIGTAFAFTAKKIDLLLSQAGYNGALKPFIVVTAALTIVPPVAAHLLDLELSIGILAGLLLGSVPPIVVLVRKSQLRRKFTDQLPNAIDLMVSVLRSGHSIPMAIKSVGSEIPSPCGTEFKEILTRMNLGQPLAEAMQYSTLKFQSYELDLIRRAIAIQSEVGGSLAELLEKTNQTLRGRLKLMRQVKVLTAQSRLTAIVVGLMPFAVAGGLQFINPGYLNPLLNSNMGQILLMVAAFLQVTGIVIMKRMSTIKV